MQIHKRKILAVFLVGIITLGLFTGCGSEKATNGDTTLQPQPETVFDKESKLSVTYLDVGQGNSTLIKLPNGEIMLIDTGREDKTSVKTLVSAVKNCSATVDYLVLTHPDLEHVGGTLGLLEEVSVKKAYLPKIVKTEAIPFYFQIYNSLVESGTEIITTKEFLNLSKADFDLVFLSPKLKGENSSYTKFNASKEFSSELADDMSPIIYLRYKGVKFLFTGDAGDGQFDYVLENYWAGIYKHAFNLTQDLELTDIHFHQLSNHGGEKGNGVNLLSTLKPKNIIISVGGNNGNGYPSSSVISKCMQFNPSLALYRTDRDRNVTVKVNELGEYLVRLGE